MNKTNQLVLQFSQQFLLTEQQVIEQLSTQKNWENRYRAVMLLGKMLNHFPQELATEQNLVQGCESQVWLQTAWCDEQLIIAGSSDAKIVKGLVAIVIAAFEGKTQQQVQSFDINNYFEQLNLLCHLSPSRVNGVLAMVKKIQNP